MTDVDQILRDHAASTRSVEPADDGWTRLVADLTDLAAEPPRVTGGHDTSAAPGEDDTTATTDDARPPGRTASRPPGGTTGAGTERHRAGRWASVAAAAVIATVLAAGAVALTRSGDDAAHVERPAGPAPAHGTAAPATTEDPSAGPPDIDRATMPDRIVAVVDHDGDGRNDLVRIDDLGATDGATDGATVLLAGTTVAPATIDSVDVGPGDVAYVAVGDEVRAIDVADGVDRGAVAEGTLPAVGGGTLATLVDGAIRLHDLSTGAITTIDEPVPGQQQLTALALSPDGQRIARQRVARDASGVTGSAVDVTDTGDHDGWVEVERSSGVGLPAFMSDGHLAVGLGTFGSSAGHAEVRASEVGMADLSTGEVRWSVGGGGFSFRYFDASPDGRWVFVGDDDLIRAFAAVDGWLWDSGTVVLLPGLVDAAW